MYQALQKCGAYQAEKESHEEQMYHGEGVIHWHFNVSAMARPPPKPNVS